MKRNIKWMKGIVLGLILAVTMSAMPVEAAEIPASLPEVEVVLGGAVPGTAEEYTIKLQAEDAAYPMPEGTKDGIYTMTIKGAGKKTLPQITFEKLGIYKYKIWQEAGKNSKCTYDNSVYHMTISVTNNKTYDGYSVVVALYKEGVTEKQEDIIFKNVYKADPVKPKPEDPEEPELIEVHPVNPAPVKTGDSARIYLYLALMAAAVVGMVALFAAKRSKKGKR